MTNLTPTPNWDDVPQLETTTKAQGGPGGPMNSQAQALANRTEALNPDNPDAQASGGILSKTAKFVMTIFAIAWVSGPGAAIRTLIAKLADLPITPQDFGAKGGETDDIAAFRAALAAAKAIGKNFKIPAGSYTLSAGLTLDNSGDTSFPSPRTSIIGDGARASILNFLNGVYNGITVIGNFTVAPVSMQVIKGIGIYKQDRQGTGLSLQSHSHITVKDVLSQGWANGAYGIDVLSSYFENVNLQYNQGGGTFIKGAYSGPNALTFLNCSFSLNANYGLDTQNGAALIWIGGSLEGNGVGNSSTTPGSIWGARILCNTSSVEGSISATFKSAYLENNGSATAGVGAGDIWYVNSGADSMLTVEDCTFQRHANYCTNNVKIDTSGGFRHKIRLRNGHAGYSDYTPSVSRPYWQVTNTTDPIEVDDTGSQYGGTTEVPNYNGAGVGRVSSAQSRLGGMVRFNGTNGAVVASFAVSGVTRTAVGTYTISFARNQPAQGTRVYQPCIQGGYGVCSLSSETASGATFTTADLSGAPKDFTNVMISWAADPAA